jgi:quercetin dioxygenase-like cupin family protein
LLKEGDIIHIPAWNLHGFKGLGEDGFEGLSIQFQETAIFESSNTPETTYIDRKKIPLQERQLIKFQREDLEELSSVEIDGKTKPLGIVKNFRSNTVLNSILDKGFSAAWVHLGDGDELASHQHDEKSMILVTKGTGEAINGIHSTSISTGDGVFVPSGAIHGFRGNGDGFWGLSIQFAQSSLYENPENARVSFLSGFDKLMIKNNKKFKELGELSIFSIPEQDFVENPIMKQRLLDCLQVIPSTFKYAGRVVAF